MGDQTRLEPGATFEVYMHWQLPGGEDIWARATFVAQVEAIDQARDRLLCKLLGIVSLRTSHSPERMDPTVLGSIKGLVGSYAYLPEEAASGVTLHLKAATLTGQLNYFFEEPPSSEEEAGVNG